MRKRTKRLRGKLFPKATDEQIARELLVLAKSGHFRTTERLAKALGLTQADMTELLRLGPRLGLWERGELRKLLASHKTNEQNLINDAIQRLTSDGN